MTPAEAKNLAALLDCDVRIEWAKEDDYRNYFRLIGVCSDDTTILLRVINDPETGEQHRGDVFWVDWADVRLIERVGE